MILSEVAKTLAGIACEWDGQIGFCLDVANLSNEQIDALCPPPDYDLGMDEAWECPNEMDVLSQCKCSNSA